MVLFYNVRMRVVNFLFLVSLGAATVVAQAPVNRFAMIEHEIKTLEVIGGSPLTSQEQQIAAQVVDMAMRSSPEHWRQTDVNMANALQSFAQGNLLTKQRIRERWRYNYAFDPDYKFEWRPEYALEKKIVVSHDPVIAIDLARKVVVTKIMMQSLKRTAVWAATVHKVPPPQPNFNEIVSSYLVQGLAGMQPNVANAFGHVEQNAPLTIGFFDSMPKPLYAKMIAGNHKIFFEPEHDINLEQWNLAQAAAVMSWFAAQHSSAPAGNMTQQQMQDILKRLSPLCGPMVGAKQRENNGCPGPIL